MRLSYKFYLIPLMILTAFICFCYWYMMMCEGDWDGAVLEDSMTEQLGKIKNDLYADVSYLADTLGPRDPTHYASLAATAKWITERWQSQGYTVGAQTFLVNGKECTNLEIEVKGKKSPDEIIIIGAQYDTYPISPGANNNGSGVSVLLKLSELIRNYQPDKTIRFVAFTTQEPPYDFTENMGSIHYARRCRERNENILVMLCMDAIGLYKNEPNSQKLPFPFSLFYPDRGNFLAFISDLGSRPYLVSTTRGFKKGSSFPIEAGCAPKWVKGVTWSDHSSFWKYGYAGIQITDTGGFRAASHTNQDDTIDKVDFNALAQITVGMYGALLELSTIERL